MPGPATLELTPPSAAATRPLLRGWLHLVAAVTMVVVGPLLVIRGRGPGETAALAVYCASMVALFGVSAAFHRVKWGPVGRRRMRRADHSTIFVGIAGSYTAVAVLALSGWAEALVLALVWTGAVVGILIRQLWLELPKWAVALPYVVVGWCAVAVAPQLWSGLGAGGFIMVAIGGAVYSVGALVYARRRPDPVPGVFGYHEVFHFCTVVGAALQFAAIAAFALPAVARAGAR